MKQCTTDYVIAMAVRPVAISFIAVRFITKPINMEYLRFFDVKLHFLKSNCMAGDSHVGSLKPPRNDKLDR